MENKQLLIETWEYQKFLSVTYSLDSDIGIEARKCASDLFAYACNKYGYIWAKAHLKPISQEDKH